MTAGRKEQREDSGLQVLKQVDAAQEIGLIHKILMLRALSRVETPVKWKGVTQEAKKVVGNEDRMRHSLTIVGSYIGALVSYSIMARFL